MENNTQQAKKGQYLTFCLKGQHYGVPISDVREINQFNKITPVPNVPEFIVGVMNLRGKVIPVVDLKIKFNLGETVQSRDTCIIVIDGQTGQTGMIVDSVSEVIELSQSEIEPRPEVGDPSRTNFIMGLGKVESKVIILIDIVHCLDRTGLGGLAEAAA